MRTYVAPDPPSPYEKKAKRLLLILAVAIAAAAGLYYLVPIYIFYYIPEELPPYTVAARAQDDTLRIIIIGDSWAEYHANLEGDTIFDIMAKRMYSKPFKATTRGKGFATSKDIYFYMFSSKTIEHSYEPDRCTQPLVEGHPDYCVIYAGINDCILRRPSYHYTGSVRSIIRLLLHNGIRPVVMEMPAFCQPNGISWRTRKERWFIQGRGLLMGTWFNDVPFYRKKLKEMLNDTGLKDSVLYIPADHWNPKGYFQKELYTNDGVHLNLDGYHVLDSCVTADITNDFIKRKK